MKKGVCVSDLHAGSFYGMLPPDFVTFEQVPKLQNPGQIYLWRCWLNFIEKVRKFVPDFVVVNGDCIDGRQAKSEGSELSLHSWKDQGEACIKTLEPLRAVTPDAKWYFTQGCLVPGHRILTADLRWIPIETIGVGDAILSVAENEARWETAFITAKVPIRKECVRVKLEDGKQFTCTKDHPFLVYNGNARVWCRAGFLKRTSRLARLLPVWEEANSKAAGYVAGFFDSEGSLDYATGNVRISAAQRPNTVIDHVKQYMASCGFDISDGEPKAYKTTDCCNYRLRGGQNEQLRFLGTYRPPRLLAKYKGAVGKQRAIEGVRVVSVDKVGMQEVVGISTSSGTYIADGYGHHNTPYHVGYFGDMEERIAEAMGATHYSSVGTGRLCREVLKLEVEPGFFLLAAHHVSLASVYTTTPLLKEGRASKGKEQLHIRSHGHHCTETMEDGVRTIMSPCWQLQTRYARKPGPQRLMPDLGGLFIEVDKGESRVWPELYEHPAIPVSKL